MEKISNSDTLNAIFQRVQSWYEIDEEKNLLLLCIETDILFLNKDKNNRLYEIKTCILPYVIEFPSHWNLNQIDWSRSFGEVQLEGNSIVLRVAKNRDIR